VTQARRVTFTTLGFGLLAVMLMSPAWLADAANPPTMRSPSGVQGGPQRPREPLPPSVHVTRRGRTLQLDCKVTDAEGRPYIPDIGERTPPHFRVYSGEQEVGSGDFRYG